MVVLAQLVRASVCGTEGRGFEPHIPPQFLKAVQMGCFFCFGFSELLCERGGIKGSSGILGGNEGSSGILRGMNKFFLLQNNYDCYFERASTTLKSLLLSEGTLEYFGLTQVNKDAT